jgi:hypothetical protein
MQCIMAWQVKATGMLWAPARPLRWNWYDWPPNSVTSTDALAHGVVSISRPAFARMLYSGMLDYLRQQMVAWDFYRAADGKLDLSVETSQQPTGLSFTDTMAFFKGNFAQEDKDLASSLEMAAFNYGAAGKLFSVRRDSYEKEQDKDKNQVELWDVFEMIVNFLPDKNRLRICQRRKVRIATKTTASYVVYTIITQEFAFGVDRIDELFAKKLVAPKRITIGVLNSLFFPGGVTFSFGDVKLSKWGDLTSRITYSQLKLREEVRKVVNPKRAEALERKTDFSFRRGPR